ncbi:MAG TPA: FAD-dependent oxidoreductase [Streptosporangiaceae bacterium]
MRVVVVGSGIVGASCASSLVKLGAQVVLVDDGAAGRATAAGAGIICPWSSAAAADPAWYALASVAARQYPELAAELSAGRAVDVGYRQVGALRLTRSEQEQRWVLADLHAMRFDAPEIGDLTALSGAAAQQLFPPLRDDSAAVLIGGAARVDGALLASALIAAAERGGAVRRRGRAELASQAGAVTGVLVDGELVEADTVVAATGAWTADFVAPVGLRVAVTPQRGQIGHISMAPADTASWPVVLPSAGGHYLLAFDDSRVVAGATREDGAGFDYRVTPGGLAEVIGQALAVAPGLADGRYLETRVGFRPVTPDNLPLLGAVPGLPGLVIATGLGPTGLTMGPYSGHLAALVALGEPPGLDLAPYDPLRRSAGTDPRPDSLPSA